MTELRLVAVLATLVVLGACTPPGTGSPPDMSKAIVAMTNAFAQCQPQDTGGSNPGSGTLQIAGSTSGNVTYDFLATLNGSTTTLSGTVSLGSTFFDASTGKVTTAPMPTVAFSPTSEYQFTPSVGVPLTMTSAGSTSIYYTVDTTMPAASQGTTLTYPGGGGITSTDTGWAQVVLAYAIGSAPNSRVSMVVYPVTPPT